jgi:hypothetical protein
MLAICVLLPAALLVYAADAPACKPTDPQLRRELLERVAVDQKARNAIVAWTKAHGPFDPSRATAVESAAWDKLTAAMIEIDRANTRWLKDVAEQHGWPTESLVGADGANAAWLLVQHADLAPDFQRRCLDLMTRLPAREVSRKNVAYLTDRVLVAEGKPQRYGTQFHVVDGQPRPRPLEDPANVDRRRAAVGLAPLAEYAKTIEKNYGRGAK